MGRLSGPLQALTQLMQSGSRAGFAGLRNHPPRQQKKIANELTLKLGQPIAYWLAAMAVPTGFDPDLQTGEQLR